jgi:hypothetical protein
MIELNKETETTKYFWTIIKFNRSSSGTYEVQKNIDNEWVARQESKVAKYKKKSVFIFADYFAEIVYGLRFELPGNILPGNELASERQLICEFWSLEEYNFVVNKSKFDQFIIIEEASKRKDLYNSNKYTISQDEVLEQTKKALGCFEAEKILMNKILLMK